MLLPVRVLGKLFRRLFLTRLTELHRAGKLAFFGALADLADQRAFLRHLAPVRKKLWVIYAKPPFAGPEAVLAYLARYTHRVAISNRRLISFDERGVTFRYKDYRRSGAERGQVMTLDPREFMHRFLLHVLPRGFHRIRHYGLLASATRKASLARARELLAVAPPDPDEPEETPAPLPPCPCCGGRIRIIDTFERWSQPRAGPQASSPTGMIASWSRTTCPSSAPWRERHGLRPPARLASSHAAQRPIRPSPRRSTRPFAPDAPSSRCSPSVSRRRSAARWRSPKPQISIAQRRRSAGSFLGDFRTPAGIRNPSRKRNGSLPIGMTGAAFAQAFQSRQS